MLSKVLLPCAKNWQLRAGNLIAGRESYQHPLNCYTTREMVRLERENLALVRDTMERHLFRALSTSFGNRSCQGTVQH